MPVKTLNRGEAEPEGLTFCRFSQSLGYSQKPFLQWHSQACRLTARGRGSPRRPGSLTVQLTVWSLRWFFCPGVL